MRLLSSFFVLLAFVISASAARADTISGTIVDVARYVTGTSSTMTMNTDLMLNMMTTMRGGVMNGSYGGMMNGQGNMGSIRSHDTTTAAATVSPTPASGESAVPMPMMSGSIQGGMHSTPMHAGSAQSGMHGAVGSATMMQGCGTVGLLTKSRTLYLLMTTSNAALRPLCSDLGRGATVTGSVHSKGGMRAIVASAIELR
jgi:hypothetical protein